MKTTYINTLDGRTEVKWWEAEDFKGRATRIYIGESAKAYFEGVPMKELVPAQKIPIPDSSVLCDFCNAAITEFPVPVVGNYALCKECFENIKKEGRGNHGKTNQ